jgi:hypothetical protein
VTRQSFTARCCASDFLSRIFHREGAKFANDKALRDLCEGPTSEG